MATAIYARSTLLVHHDYYSYPWNYANYDTDWPYFIGIFGQQSGNDILKGWAYDAFGASTRPGYMEGVPGHDDPSLLFPSEPWSADLPDTRLLPLIDIISSGITAETLSLDFYDPPPGYRFEGNGIAQPRHWTGAMNYVLWARGTYGRYLYRGSGPAERIELKEIVRIDGTIEKRGLAPIVGSLLLLTPIMLQGAAAVPCRRRKR